MTMNFGQHDSGSGRHNLGRDDFRATRPVTVHINFFEKNKLNFLVVIDVTPNG